MTRRSPSPRSPGSAASSAHPASSTPSSQRWFSSLPSHARDALSAAARCLQAHEATLDGEVAEYMPSTPWADKLRWRAVEASVKEVLCAKEFLKAIDDVTSKVGQHATRWHARAGPLSVPVEPFEGMRANARPSADDVC